MEFEHFVVATVVAIVIIAVAIATSSCEDDITKIDQVAEDWKRCDTDIFIHRSAKNKRGKVEGHCLYHYSGLKDSPNREGNKPVNPYTCFKSTNEMIAHCEFLRAKEKALKDSLIDAGYLKAPKGK